MVRPVAAWASARKLLAVGGVADRAGGHDVDVLGVEMVGAAEAGEDARGSPGRAPIAS